MKIYINELGHMTNMAAKIKFGHIGFCMGKNENYYFLETIAASGLN